MQILLVTHARELDRPTNTGRLVMEACGQEDPVRVQRIVWQRAQPDDVLLSALSVPGVGLLYPSSEMAGDAGECERREIEACQTFILLDGTWQEARKMFNRSPYLKPVPRISLAAERASRFNKRRNQRAGCLCTAECVIEILRRKGQHDVAARLDERFSAFLSGAH